MKPKADSGTVVVMSPRTGQIYALAQGNLVVGGAGASAAGSKVQINHLSAGRVQSVAVRLICDRERDIQAFVPVEYWSIVATLTPKEKEDFTRIIYW